MLTLLPFDKGYLPTLYGLLPEGAEPHSLSSDLTDTARGHGSQVVVAVEGGQALGVAGWVTFGVAATGILYGTPLLANEKGVAVELAEHLLERARSLGARQLRISCVSGEAEKARALRECGFEHLFDLISMECTHALPQSDMPSFLHSVPFEAIDWEAFARCYNRNFSQVPNAPPVESAIKQEEWLGLDPEASSLWSDETGRYVAWIGVDGQGYVDEIGVDDGLRGRGIAAALYGRAGTVLAKRGVKRLHTLLASTNTATLRLHDKLGFTEFARRQVFGRDVAAGQKGDEQ